jgi:hypothetical protein
MCLYEPLPWLQRGSLYSQGRHDPSMVGRPQARRSSAVRIGIIADNIGAHGTETIFRGTIAEQHEIEPLGEIDRSVEQVFLMSPGVA